MDSFSGLLSNSALMITLCVIYDTFGLYTIARKNLRDLFTGLLTGLVTIAVMLTPWSLQPGVFFDTRWVLLSLCGLFVGLIATSVAVIIAGSFRLYQGGPGGTVGTIVIVVTACVGLIWKYWKDKKQTPLDWKRLYVFGFVVQLAMLSCMFLMPANMRIPIIKAVAPPILIIYPILTMVIGLILKRQEDRRTTDRELEEHRKNLASEKERLAVTLRSIGDGVITTDIFGNVVLINNVAEKLTGWSKEDAVGRPLEDVFHIINEQTREVCENPASKVLTTGLIVDLANHTALIANDGSEVSIADSGAPIRDTQSQIIGVVLVFRDVTEQIKAEKERLKVEKLESIGLLAGGIAHDFNNILVAILGNVNLALFDEDLKDNTRKLLSEAEKASLRAKDLTQQLLTFSKGGEPVKETSSLESVIKDSASFVLHGDKVACHYEIPEDLWLVDIDKGQISQVIQNIVLNASHAMPDGGLIDISCENITSFNKNSLSQSKEGKFVKICISDSGIGIPVKCAEKIFDPYFSTKQEGSGLGLAITQSIINKHNGKILVDSAVGDGTTFSIYLPASEKTKPQVNTSIEESETTLQANILVMDDDEMVRSVTKAMLEQVSHKVSLVADGDTAIKLYQESMNSESTFDLVIMDLTIPGGMGGKEASQAVLKINPKAKIIVSSGYSNDPIMANFKDYGFCDAIVKPFQFLELSRVLNKVLN
jgi:two-component system cell cycle sensor histidine kinase/response regulator CckA